MKFGISNINVNRAMIPTLEPSQMSALTIGIPAAINESNVISRMMKAVTIPTSSEEPPT